MARLVVTEKHSVAKDIAKVLKITNRSEGCYKGRSVWVTWCVGHLVELCEPAEYDPAWKRWQAEHLPMLPESFKLRPIKRTADRFKEVRQLMRSQEIEEIINACDAGREGELIFRLVYDLAGCRKPVRRLWLSSMTAQAIQDAFMHMRPGEEYDALGDAARCRSESDWLVGLNATRALTLHNRRSGGDQMMSVGRVQTPTLAMLVHREEEIEAFVPEPFWEVFAWFQAEEGRYEGKWFTKDADRLTKEEDARGIEAAVKGQTGRATKVEHKKVQERPPLLFDLTQLQRRANQRYGLSAQATLQAAQDLYEKHKLLTYPRTDSNYLTSDMKAGLPSRLQGVEVGDWAPYCRFLLDNQPLKITARIVNDKEVGDHHAIIPTGRTPNMNSLSDTERKVFDMVVRRFIAVFYPDAVFATTRIETEVGDHCFLTTGRVRLEAGWQEVEPPLQAPPPRGQKKETQAPDLPRVRKGEQVPVLQVRVHQGMTQPPKRYNEAALLGAMERAGKDLEDDELRRAMKESGLGTPATRAAIIETLLQRSYIERSGKGGKTLVPTSSGRALIGALSMELLKSPKLTGEWEMRLSQIADGRYGREQFMGEVQAMVTQMIPSIFGGEPVPQSDLAERSLGACPVCGREVIEGFKTYSCVTGGCSFVIFKKIAGRKISPKLVGVLLSRRISTRLKGFKSRAGKPFEACLALTSEGKVEFRFDNDPQAPSHPSAPSTPQPPQAAGASRSRAAKQQVEQDSAPQEPQPPQARASRSARTPPAPPSQADGPAQAVKSTRAPARQEEGDTAQASEASGMEAESVPCPSCHQGTIIRGRRGWGCSRWREGCRFVVWFQQFGHTLPDDEADRLLRKGKTRLMNGFTDESGQPVRARLALDMNTEPPQVRLEPSAPAKSSRAKPSTTKAIP